MSLLPRIVVLVALLRAGALLAQPDTSLTREFDGLSAKERNRIAKREQEEAAQDVRYQALMVEAEDHFRAKRYEESLAVFTKARELRPYNVYPKVKIQDLRALIARRDEEAARQVAATPAAEQPTSSITPVIVAEPPRPAPVPVQTARSTPPVVADPPPVSKPAARVERAPVTKPAHTPAVQKREPERTLPPVPEGGMDERVYKEGRAVVRERRVMAEGKEAIYRRVTHPWGEVVYFKDGIAITERAWAEVFGD